MATYMEGDPSRSLGCNIKCNVQRGQTDARRGTEARTQTRRGGGGDGDGGGKAGLAPSAPSVPLSSRTLEGGHLSNVLEGRDGEGGGAAEAPVPRLSPEMGVDGDRVGQELLLAEEAEEGRSSPAEGEGGGGRQRGRRGPRP